MNLRLPVIRLLAVVFTALPALGAELKISAAASLSEAMTEIAALYEKEHGEKPQLNFGGSNALARQIRAGAPCDVFFSADEATLNQLLEDKLLHENSVTKLLGNSLVVITPVSSPLVISSAADLASPSIKRLALGDPAAVPAGVYARKWLEGRQQWDAVAGKVVATENVRAALAAVASTNAGAGIVYRTDAMISRQVKVAYEVPTDQTPPIIYPAAATKSSPDPGRAIRFIAFLRSEPSLSIFGKHGFRTFPTGGK
ncbi:molybdate ABC transporter substrate-binding protein [Luteolibacter sp. SL250]|uniref:molybdate ABC transporter substrate-binding protein n=1 Tax=Luteolibacter sp. SL250 TaxID=2995170 RepID=UPI00226EA0C0|nr:molybdate ABC transporter substrate-binding protein [Luteolibacter sp. SL250]WAC19376.1 molybdate ABC transporter substrate-binding protein [Luteolibacter sp. SL250]